MSMTFREVWTSADGMIFGALFCWLTPVDWLAFTVCDQNY